MTMNYGLIAGAAAIAAGNAFVHFSYKKENEKKEVLFLSAVAWEMLAQIFLIYHNKHYQKYMKLNMPLNKHQKRFLAYYF